MDHIGAVQPAAHAHFNHGHIDFGLGKCVKGKAYAHFEKAQLQGAKPWLPGFHKVHYFFGGQFYPLDPNSFCKGNKMGGGVEADPVSCLLEATGEHVGGGALSVGAGDVEGGKTALRMPQGLHEGHGFRQIHFVGSLCAPRVLKHRELGVEPFQCFREGAHCREKR